MSTSLCRLILAATILTVFGSLRPLAMRSSAVEPDGKDANPGHLEVAPGTAGNICELRRGHESSV